MRVYKGVKFLDSLTKRACVTVGNFDGVHLGHQEILHRVLARARDGDAHSVAVTFRPHPQEVLNPGAAIPLLNRYDEKLERLEALGVEIAIEEPFSREFSSLSAEAFFRGVLVRRLNAASLVVGYDFGFGHDRAGQEELLSRLAGETGVALEVVPPLRVGADVVSSSCIRRYLSEGNARRAADLLGYEYFRRGQVVRGDGRGRRIGFPTANLHSEPKAPVANGVYATRVLWRGVEHPAVTNVGVRPTFVSGAAEPTIETHLLGVDVDLYGESIEVRFVDRIRDERRFSGIDELKGQISLDAERAASILGR